MKWGGKNEEWNGGCKSLVWEQEWEVIVAGQSDIKDKTNAREDLEKILWWVKQRDTPL